MSSDTDGLVPPVGPTETSRPPDAAPGADDGGTDPAHAPASVAPSASDDAPDEAAPDDGSAGERNPRRGPRDLLETLIVAVLVVLFVTTFAVQNSVIPTASMEDTLLIGDYLLVNKVVFAPEDADAPTRWLAQRPVERGDVVVFKFPNDPAVDYIKRVIGLPGDSIEIRNKQLRVNGAAVDEPYKRHKTGLVHPAGPGPDGTRDNFGPVVVPEGQLFVMGDNRDYSADSREWRWVPRSHVTGRAFLIFWSREQRPGSWHASGLARIQRVLEGLKTFYRDTRWGRIGTRVE